MVNRFIYRIHIHSFFFSTISPKIENNIFKWKKIFLTKHFWEKNCWKNFNRFYRICKDNFGCVLVRIYNLIRSGTAYLHHYYNTNTETATSFRVRQHMINRRAGSLICQTSFHDPYSHLDWLRSSTPGRRRCHPLRPSRQCRPSPPATINNFKT
jgi:hypothetical protein